MNTRAKTAASALALVLATTLLYARGLHDAPIYLVHDEIMFSLQAHSLASRGRDLMDQPSPLFFSEPKFKAGRDPISIYATAFLLKFLPFTEWTMRIPTAIVGIIDVFFMWLVARRLFRREALAIVAAALLALTPVHFMYSRVALSVIYPLPFLMAWLLGLLIYVERDNVKALCAGTACLGIGVYSYLGFLAMTPVYLLLTAYAIVPRRSLRPYVIAAVGFLLPLLPLMFWHLQHPSRYADLVGDYRLHDPHLNPLQGAKDLTSYFSLGVRSGVYWNFFNPSFLFFSGDSSLVNSTREIGVLLLPFAILLPLGVYQVLDARRNPYNIILLLGLATAPLAATLMATVEVRRAMVLVPFAVLIAMFGVDFLMTRGRLWRLAAVALLVLGAVQFQRFHVDYFNGYRTRSSMWLGGNFEGAFSAIVERLHEPDAKVYLSMGIPYVDPYWNFFSIKYSRPDLLTRQVYYEPKALDVRTVPPRTLVLGAAGEDPGEAVWKSEGWRQAAVIAELDGRPLFVVYEK